MMFLEIFNWKILEADRLKRIERGEAVTPPKVSPL